jgi:hypothetical protein
MIVETFFLVVEKRSMRTLIYQDLYSGYKLDGRVALDGNL